MSAKDASPIGSGARASTVQELPRYKSNWMRGHKWAVFGLVLGSLVTIGAILATVVIKTDLLSSKMNFMKDVTIYGASVGMGVGALTLFGSSYYLHTRKYMDLATPDEDKKLFRRLNKGEFMVYQLGDKMVIQARIAPCLTYDDGQMIEHIDDRIEHSDHDVCNMEIKNFLAGGAIQVTLRDIRKRAPS